MRDGLFKRFTRAAASALSPMRTRGAAIITIPCSYVTPHVIGRFAMFWARRRSYCLVILEVPPSIRWWHLKGNLSSRQSRVAQMLALQEQASASRLPRLQPFPFVARTSPMRFTTVPVTSVDQTQSTGIRPRVDALRNLRIAMSLRFANKRPAASFWAASFPGFRQGIGFASRQRTGRDRNADEWASKLARRRAVRPMNK